MTFHRKPKDRKTRKGWYRVGPKGRNLVKFVTAYVSKTMSSKEFNPPATYLILRNRGDDSTPPTGDIELFLTTSDSNDTFLLRCGERERFGPSKEGYKKICYKRSDDGNRKVRLDIHCF